LVAIDCTVTADEAFISSALSSRRQISPNIRTGITPVWIRHAVGSLRQRGSATKAIRRMIRQEHAAGT
jgi:hypothetical protein